MAPGPSCSNVAPMLTTRHPSGVAARPRPSRRPGDHRFEIPATPRHYVPRDRLRRQLDAGHDLPLTLVSAPAGSGKTALLAAWASGRKAGDVAWLAPGTGDESSVRFWPLVTETLRRSGLRVAQHEDDERLETTRHSLTRLSSALAHLPRRITLVLDGFEGRDPAVASELDFVMSHSGRRLRVVMLTQLDPMLPLHRFRLEEAITELRMADLAFTEDETAQLLHRFGVRLGSQSVSALIRRTRGRALELTIAGMLLARSDDPEHALTELHEASGSIIERGMSFLLPSPLTHAPQGLVRSRVVEIPHLALPGHPGNVRLREEVEGVLLEEVMDHPGWFRVHPYPRDLPGGPLAYPKAGAFHRAATTGVVRVVVPLLWETRALATAPRPTQKKPSSSSPAVAVPQQTARRQPARETRVLEGGEVIEPLTAKEHEVLQHLAELLTTEEIAAAMFISVNTVRTHVRSILRKLAVSRRNEAVRRGRAMSLVPG
jgi:ATP/maltotriose-dependent transcriptional regulator MalT